MQAVGDVHDTLLRPPDLRHLPRKHTRGFGVGRTDHLSPSHRSARVAVPRASVSKYPTARQAVKDVHVTDWRLAEREPDGAAAGCTVQLAATAGGAIMSNATTQTQTGRHLTRKHAAAVFIVISFRAIASARWRGRRRPLEATVEIAVNTARRLTLRLVP